MTVFSPENDPVVLREHLYFDSNDPSLVLRDSAEFTPVETQGLGLFTYKYEVLSEPSNDALSGFFLGFATVSGCAVVVLLLARLFVRMRGTKIIKKRVRVVPGGVLRFKTLSKRSRSRSVSRSRSRSGSLYATSDTKIPKYEDEVGPNQRLLPALRTDKFMLPENPYRFNFDEESELSGSDDSVFSPYSKRNISVDSFESPAIEQEPVFGKFEPIGY